LLVNLIRKQLKPEKAPGGVLITQKIIIELPNFDVAVIFKLFNGIIKPG